MSECLMNSMDVFVPEYCIQGDRIPFYLIWNKQENIRISLCLSDGLKLEEAYNVSDENISLKDDTIEIDNFEVQGYFGGIIKSNMYKDASIIKTIKFSINVNNVVVQNFEKNIELFRPDIKIDDSISEINIQRKKNKFIIDKQIPLYNNGKGTAIIKLEILDSSEIKQGIPEGHEEFRIKFMQDIHNGLDNLRLEFPIYEDLIAGIKLYVDDPLPNDPNKLSELRTIFEKLEIAFDNNKDFVQGFAQCIVTAYLKNVSVLTDVTAFLAFMKSVTTNKIIFIDAMTVLKISTINKTLHAKIIISDLTHNRYAPIELKHITIKANEECNIPLYQIFNTTMVDT